MCRPRRGAACKLSLQAPRRDRADCAENSHGTRVAGGEIAMSERAVTGKVATIGVDVGGTAISGGLVRDDGEVLATVEAATPASGRRTAVTTGRAGSHAVQSQ